MAAPSGSENRCLANQVSVSSTSLAVAAASGVRRSVPASACPARYSVSAASTGLRMPEFSRSAISGSSRAERSSMSAASLVRDSSSNSSRRIFSSSAAVSPGPWPDSASASAPNGTTSVMKSRASLRVASSGAGDKGRSPAGRSSSSSAWRIASTNRPSLLST